MEPSLATSDKSIIRLPDIDGNFDPYIDYVKPDKGAAFKKKDTTPEPVIEEKPAVFFSLNLTPQTEHSVEVSTKKKKEPNIMNTSAPSQIQHTGDFKIAIPKSDPLFVPFGFFDDLETIIKSGVFHPAYITGLSGNGKTFGVTESCAKHKRKFVRVPITVESDEDSLLGGFRLVDGNTVFQLGPIPEAMLAGAVCLLDEVDKASSKIMCLQPVLEGQPIYLKRINKLIEPAPGFNIIATANTKGQGSETGSFITSLVLDEAFLERFAVTFEQDYPESKIETKILRMLLKTFNNLEDDDFIKMLIEWANSIRKAYSDGAHTSVVTTRRLTHIIKNFAIFGQDRQKSVALALNRFDTETKKAFMELWTAKCPIVEKSFNNAAKSTTAPTYSNDATNRRPF
jgi:MoxR-like ATPase